MFFDRRSKDVNKMILGKDTDIMTRLMFAGWIIGASNVQEFVTTLVESIIFWGAVKQVYMNILFESIYYAISFVIH